MGLDDGGWRVRPFSARPGACIPFQPKDLQDQGSSEEMTHNSQISGDMKLY